MDPTQQQLQNRSNPTPFQANIPSSGLFRGVGDYGTTIYSGDKAINLIGDTSGLFKDSAERASFGNAAGQASEALNRLKTNYGIDWNSLPTVNIGDFISAKNKESGSDFGPSGFNFQKGSINDVLNQPNASISTQTLNTQPNHLATITPQIQNSLQPTGPIQVTGTQPLAAQNVSPSYTVKSGDTLSKIASSNGMSLQQVLDLNPQFKVNPNLILPGQTVNLGQSPIGSSAPTPQGTVSNTPVDIQTKDIYSSSALNGNSTTNVMGTRQSYEDTINNYLQQVADAQAKVNAVKGLELQGNANIMYGQNGSGGADLAGQSAQTQQLNRNIAFQQVPADIALSNAQTALSLYQQSPQYLSQKQAMDTSFNILQQYPDIGVQYDQSKSPQENLQAIQAAMPSSPRYQALMNYAGISPVTGTPIIFNKSGGTTQSAPLGSISVGSGGKIDLTSQQTISSTAQSQLPAPTNLIQKSFLTDFTSGTLGTAKNSLNTAVGHLFDADQKYQDLGNYGGLLTPGNLVKNTIAGIFGSSKPSDYGVAQDLASGELAKAYGNNAEADRAALSKFGGVNQSPEQHAGYIKTAGELLSSKLGAIAEQYKGAMGTYPPSLDVLISPLNQVKLASTGLKLDGIVPGVPVSTNTQAMIKSAQVASGVIYLPDQSGKYYPIQ